MTISNSDPSAAGVTRENIDKLVTDLRMFAIGSYLQSKERESWEPLSDEAVANQVEEALREAIASISQVAELAADKREETAAQTMENCLQCVAAVKRERGGSIFDEELDEILTIANPTMKAVGLDLSAVRTESYLEMEQSIQLTARLRKQAKVSIHG